MVERVVGYNTSTGKKQFIGTRNIDKGKGILSGRVEGDAARNFSIVSLIVAVEGKPISIGSTTIALTAPDGSNPRVDLLQVDSDGTLSMKDGTAAADPACPAPDTGQAALAVAYVPANGDNVLRDMNEQTAVTQPVVIANYYANGGLHASRVGVTADPSTTSDTFVDADEMTLPVYFPDDGYSYELCWDVVIQETYGVLREGAVIGIEIDGTDKTEAIFARSSAHELLDADSIFRFDYFLSVHLNQRMSQGAHIIQGRWQKDGSGTSIEMKDQQRRIWIYQVAQPEVALP